MWIWVFLFVVLSSEFSFPITLKGKHCLEEPARTLISMQAPSPGVISIPSSTQPSLMHPGVQPRPCQWSRVVVVARPYLQQQGDGDTSRADAHGAEAGDDEGPPAQLLDGEALPRESRDHRGEEGAPNQDGGTL